MLLNDAGTVFAGDSPALLMHRGGLRVWESLTHLPAISNTVVTFTVNGSTFAPQILTHGGAPMETFWLVDGDVASSDTMPVFDFGTSAVRIVKLCTETPELIHTINLGFNHNNDAGEYNIGPAYDYPPQPVIEISGLARCPNLINFCAANTLLTGHLDVSGLSNLEYIECFRAHVTSVDLEGCTSLIRLCFEENACPYLDLNPVAANLFDLRTAGNLTGNLTFANLLSPMPNLYHFCVRGQNVNNPPPTSLLPLVREYWAWNATMEGAFVAQPLMGSILIRGNTYTSANLSALTRDGGYSSLVCSGNQMTSITWPASHVIISRMLFDGNNLSQSQVDLALTHADGMPQPDAPNPELNLYGSAPPSSVGLAAKTSLESKGWTITVTV